MFTLHLLQTDGKLTDAIGDDLLVGEAFACEHAQTARAKAKEYATTNNTDVVVVRDGDRACYTITRRGETTPPPNARVPEREQCKRGSGQACFCLACRADRRAQRDAADS